MATARLADLESRLGHRFADPSLLERALTHSSFSADHNERLEFLGDGVLGCAVAHELYKQFPTLDEGKMSLMRAAMVREAALAEVGRGLGLEPLIRRGASMATANKAMLADAVEAVFGAVFLDAGYSAARDAVLAVFAPFFARLDPNASTKDAKTRLQEKLHGKNQPEPGYVLIEQGGPAHQRSFTVECVAGDSRTIGRGASIKAAQQQAAQAMLDKLGG